MNRRGDEIVEAAMVLPILILTILSLIMLLIYFFACLQAQTDMHRQLVKEADSPKAVFEIKTKTTETSSKMGGAVSLIMHRTSEASIYAIDHADMIRLGQAIGGDDDDT